MKSLSTPQKLVVCTSLFAAIGAVTPVAGQFTFDVPINMGTGQRPNDVAAGDWDNDGDLDFAVTTNGTGNQDRLEIYLNDGFGTYTPGAVVALPNSSSPGDVEAADLDGDGDTDIAVILRDFNQVMAVINTGGVFTAGPTSPVGVGALGMSQADMDGDGDVDLIVANRDDNTATVLVNTGTASFNALTLFTGADPRWATFVDINGDANLDAAVTNHRDRTVSLFTNNGGGFVSAGTLSTGAGLRPAGITAADLNGDGREDLASGTGNPENASVWLNTGGAFGVRGDYPTGGASTSEILAADFDCDGDMDLATVNSGSNNVSVLANNSAGVFAATTILSVGSTPTNFATADIDNDGDADLLVVNRDSNNVSIIENMTCAPSDVALLETVEVTTGSLLSGGVAELIASDDAVVHTRSGFGSTLLDLHKMDMVVGASTGNAAPTMMSISIESRISESSGTATLFLWDWNAGRFRMVGQHALGSTDTIVQINGIGTGPFVDDTGRINLMIRHVVFVPFLAFIFESFIDHIEIIVE